MKSTYIKKGGFGIVEKVEFTDGSILARKSLQKTLQNNVDLRRRFKREVTYQSNFDHINIVSILNSDLDGEQPWFTMPLATCHLGDENSANVAFNFHAKTTAFFDVLNALEAVHSAGYVHRDIKPENILRYDNRNGGYLYALSDFGLISPSDRSNTTNITATSEAIGTTIYMARECYLNGFRDATIQSDIYSLGVLLLFLFKRIDESLGVPYDERESSSEFGYIISGCTKRKPEDRYQSISQLRNEFQIVVNNIMVR